MIYSTYNDDGIREVHSHGVSQLQEIGELSILEWVLEFSNHNTFIYLGVAVSDQYNASPYIIVYYDKGSCIFSIT